GAAGGGVPGLDRARALKQLRPRELPLFLRLSALAAIAPLLMRLPLPRIRAFAARPRRPRELPVTVARLDWLMALAPQVAHPLVRRGCLTRGVTLLWLLRRSGLDLELRVGADPLSAAAAGHCWPP